jgi:hypothetical protein
MRSPHAIPKPSYQRVSVTNIYDFTIIFITPTSDVRYNAKVLKEGVEVLKYFNE